MTDIELFNKRYEEQVIAMGDDKAAFKKVLREYDDNKEISYPFLEESYVKFRKNYKKLIRIGFVGILVVPLFFMILMFNLESKIVFLSLWIASFVISSVYIIVLEYMDYSYKKRLGIKNKDEEDETD